MGRSVRAGLLVASLALSLALAEAGARLVRGGAFPHLNLFRASTRYGVTLEPSAATRVRSRGGRVTEVRTNSLGFRGPEAHAPRVLLLGDSQMMGYGVDWPETIAPALSRALGVEVLAAAVPSWGPSEYLRAVEDLAPRFR